MSFRDEEELDWGEEDYRNPGEADAVDTLSLGDEEEILHADFGTEGDNEDDAPRAATPQQEALASPGKNRLGGTLSAQSSALGLSHLPPKPRMVMPGGRSRETIKAAAMSRQAPRSRSPPASAPNDLPPNWEVRHSELTVYYYHTVLCASQLKRPTREDARLDKASSWPGEEPPPSDRLNSQSTRNAPSSRAAWPENSAPGRYSKNSRTSSPPPPRAKSPSQRPNQPEEPRRGRADSRQHKQQQQQQQQQQQPPRPRSISPASMLLPRRGQSPARGLAKSGSDSNETRTDSAGGNRPDNTRSEFVQKTRREAWDRRAGMNQTPPQQLDHYSPEPEVDEPPSRSGRTPRDNEILQAPRVTGSRRSKQYDDAHEARGIDHYSPPPENDKAPLKHATRRSDSPGRRGGMRSDAMIVNQYSGRRSVSPRLYGHNRNFEHPPMERANFDSRSRPDLGRTRSDADLSKRRDSGRGARDPRGEEYRGRDIRPSPRDRHTDLEIQTRHRPGPGPPLAPEDEIYSPAVDEPIYPDVHPTRLERFHERAEGPRPPRMGPVQPDMPMNSPHLSPHAVRNDAALPPRHDPNFESHGGYPRNQRQPNPRHRRERSPPVHEHHPPPPENEFIPANRNMIVPGPQRHDMGRPRDSNLRGRQQDHQLQDRTAQTWERGVEVPTPPPEEGRFDNRRQDNNNGRKNWRRNEYPGRQHPPEEEPTYENEHPGPARFGRPVSPEAKRSYPPADREWTPRQPPAQVEMEVDPEPPVRPEPLPGWAGFRRGEPEERRGRGPQNWTGPPENEQGVPPMENDDARKRRRVNDGAEVVSLGRAEHEFARKIPHRSPVQRPKPQSPVNSFNPLPNPVAIPLLVPPVPPVDPAAALARAQDIAAQLGRTAPGASRGKSRFGPTATPAGVAESPPKPAPESFSIKGQEARALKEGLALAAEAHVKIGTDSPSHQSDDSSAPLATRLGDTSIGEDVSQSSDARPLHRQNSHGHWKSNSFNRNGGEFRGRNKGGDVWRSENDEGPREVPMRTWGKPNQAAHGDSQAPPTFVPNSERTFIPRDGVERGFMNNNQRVAHEGLPARPPMSPEFLPIPNAGGARRAPPSASRPQPSLGDLVAGSPASRDRGTGYDGHPADANLDASFQEAGTPRKNSLLNRMTEPGGGELSLMARLSSADQGPQDGYQQQRQRRPKAKQGGPRR
ncbi:hypothetical protein RhiLY_09554 [Ceratobasidium sp. AG-Ba]|nr:hypothetical protein RhiLY_09554 [Ceratobasidium sp. AG-Ba]